MTIKVESFDQYQQLAIRTMKDDPHLMKVLHCTMGMVGEAGEFAELPYDEEDKRIGEIGDCMWYAANLAHTMGWNLSSILQAVGRYSKNTVDDLVKHTSETRAMLWSARLNDIVKKSVFYGKELPVEEVRKCLACYMSAVLDMASKMSVMPLVAAELNIKKLSARYPDLAFNADHAINRDYEVESKAAGIQIA